jgi:hypothetical protein
MSRKPPVKENRYDQAIQPAFDISIAAVRADVNPIREEIDLYNEVMSDAFYPMAAGCLPVKMLRRATSCFSVENSLSICNNRSQHLLK